MAAATTSGLAVSATAGATSKGCVTWSCRGTSVGGALVGSERSASTRSSVSTPCSLRDERGGRAPSACRPAVRAGRTGTGTATVAGRSAASGITGDASGLAATGWGVIAACHETAPTPARAAIGNPLPVAAQSCRVEDGDWRSGGTSPVVAAGGASSLACAKDSAKLPAPPPATPPATLPACGVVVARRVGDVGERVAVWIIRALGFGRVPVTQQGSCRTFRNAGASSISRIAFSTASASARASSFSTAL
ncbi:hypothetical protein C8J45_105194 [Sphingomonas sp. PP-CE-3G-477]|nr:hypothetical protein C8J45_105194 [Sphingomonas sp. PP-CE-3G-477]